MAVSMKDLQSSDEEFQDGDVDADVNKEKWIRESDRLANTSHQNQNTFSEGPKYSGGWIKGQVSESLKRISTRMTTVTSESAQCSDIDIDDAALQQKLTKVSDADVKIPAETSEVRERDGVSKRHWIKGQINNYFSKSKRLYYNRNEMSSSYDKKLSVDVGEDDKELMCPLNATSVDSGLPSLREAPLSPKNTKTSKGNSPRAIQKTNAEADLPIETDVENELLLPKLTFSELLNSECPTASSSVKNNEQPVDVNNDYVYIESVNNESVNNAKKYDNNNSNNIDSNTTATITTVASATTNINTMSGNTPNSPTSDCIGNQTVFLSEEEELNNLTDQIIKEDLQYHLRPGESTGTITFFNIWVCTCLTYAYFVYRPPSYIQGIITGSLLTYLMLCIVVWFLCPSAEVYDSYQSSLKSFLKRNRKPPDPVKGLPKLEVLAKPKDLRGWIFFESAASGVFDKDSAKEVYSIIHKERLYIFLCKASIPEPTTEKIRKNKRVLKGRNKKANHLLPVEQPLPMFVFESGYLIDIPECLLELKPDDLSIRRIWNRKYPIQITVPQGKLRRKNIDLTLEELTLMLDDIIEAPNNENFMEENTIVNDKEETFYMFWNTGREKEDWFYRLQLCVAPLKHQVTFKDECTHKKSSKQPCNSYPHYMTELIKESEKVMQRTVNGKKMQPYLAWLNIFLGRAFWDFWHESVWAQKLHQKIQTRLSKLNTPPFITDITLTDLNCGHNIPIIHKGSMPVLDEHGIWADLQISYKGYFTLTLETQLNIDYYISLVSSIVKKKGEAKENMQLSKLKLSSFSNQFDDNADDSLSEKDIHDSETNSLPDVDEFHDEIQDVYSDAFDQPDHQGEAFPSGVDTNESDPFMADPRTKAFLESRTGKKVVSLVGWLAKSKIAKRVAETDFAKKAYERAYKKFQKMPIVLKVEIQSVKGNLAVNIPPPPTNRLWYGFRGNPVIFITASPKVGDKQVRLTYLTNWIERKLKEEFKKFLVLPNMQDLSIKLMDSHLHDINPERPLS